MYGGEGEVIYCPKSYEERTVDEKTYVFCSALTKVKVIISKDFHGLNTKRM